MKNNHDLTPNRMNKYAIRKLSVGTASLLVGSVLVFGISNDANAAENDLSKDSKALSTNVNEEDNHLVDIEKANSNEQNPVNDFSESHDIHNDNLNTSDSASEQSVVENKPTVNNTAEIDTSNKEREVAVNTTKNKVTDNKENNNNTSNVIEKEIEESKANKTNEENSEIVKTENKMKAAHNFDNSFQKFENRETSDIAEKATINQSEAQNREDISHVENNTSTKLEVKDEVNTQSENIKPASEHNVPDRNNTESVLNTKESNNAVAKVRKRRSIINRKTSSKAMTEDSAVEALEYSENYTFQTLIFDPESLAKNSVLNSKTIPFEIHSYMTGANSGDRYKINLQLDPIIANHVTRITVNPAGRTSPVQFVRLSNKQGRLTNIWQVNFIRANNGLFGGGEILSQYTASNGVIYLDTTVKNILNSMNNKHDKLNYLIYVKDNSENKKIQTSETSGYFLTAAEREINNIPPSQSTNANNSFKASSGTVQYDPKIGNFGGAIIDQQILKNGIFNYRGKILDAGLYKQWTYHYQIDPALLPYIGSIELHKQDFRGLYGFDKKYYAANKVATLRVDSKGRGSITHSDLNQLIEFNNALPETVGIRIVIKYNQSPNNILTRNASYDQNGNLISSTTQVKEDFAFYGYFTDRNGGIINNTFGSATYYIQDLDKDGLTDNYEIHNSHSDPFNGDTDRDGKNDGDEVLRYQTSPLVGKPIVNDITTEDTIIRGDVPLDKSAARQKVKILNPNGNVIKQGALNKNGTFSFNVSKLPPGKYKVAIESPNYRNAEVNTFNVIDMKALLKPAIAPVNDQNTNLQVKGVEGSTVVVKDNNNNVIGTVVLGKGETTKSLQLNQPLKAGTVLTATATKNGKTSYASDPVTVTDVTAPIAPTVTEVTSESAQVTGTGEPGSTITVKLPDGSVATGTADNQGNYAIDIPTNVDLVGNEELVVTSTDGAGNVSPETRVTVKDTTAPVAPMVNEVTSEGTQVTGTGEAGSTITVKFPDGNTATGTVDNQGNYVIDIPTTVDLVGNEEVVVTSTDGVGNVSPETKITVKDVTAPVAPMVNEVTSEGTQVTGTGEAGSTITVKFPDGNTVTGTADDQGNYAIDIPTNVDLVGNEELVVTSTDGAGNVSPETKVTVTDVTAPVAPMVSEVTSEGTQVTGSGEAGSIITVKFPDGSTVTGTADDQGNYAIDIPINVDLVGNEELVVTSTDSSGNVSPETKVTVTDVTAPSAPTMSEVTSEDSQVTGTGEPGSTITVKFPDGSTVTGTADDQGNYAIDIPTNLDLVGNEELVVTSTDGAGNVSPETRVTVTDVTAPVAPRVNEVTSEGTQVTGTGEAGSTITVKFPDGSVVTGVADDQGNYAIDIPKNVDLVGNEELVVTSTDGAGNVSPETRETVKDVTAPVAPTVSEVTSEDSQVTGTGEPGSTITVKFPDGSTVTGTADDQGNYAIDIPTNLDLVGKEELVVTSTDGAGNVSPETKVTVTDVTAPVAPTVNEVTSEGTQVAGSGEAGSTITVKFPDGSVVTGTADDQGNYAIDIPTNLDLVGKEELVVTSTDVAGNVSPETKVTVTDVTAPVAPTVNEVTSEGTQVAGSGEAGSTITVKFPDGSTVTGTVDNQGNYAINIPTNVDLVGKEELVVTSTDEAGNVSPETRVTVKDTTAPVAPMVNEVTSESTQVTGTGEAGSTITVNFPDGNTATGTVDNQGNYAIDIPTTVDLVGKEELVVTSTDGAGNVSPETRETVKDVTAPVAPTVSEVTSEDSQVTGTGEVGSTITVKFPDGSVVTGTVNDQGNYAIDIPTTVDLVGKEELVVTSTDGAGNVSPETKITVKDVTVPVAPTVSEVTSEGTQVTGTGEAGSTITVKFPDGSVVTGTVDDQGNYVIHLPVDKKLNGNEELVVTSTDGVGNVSPESKVTVTDVTAPDAPTVNQITSEGTQVTGTGEAGSTITVKFPDGSFVTGTADNQGNYVIDIPTNVDLVGNEELVVTSTDGAGNVSPETRVTVTDATVPNAPTVNEVTSEGTQVTGTGEAGSTITVKFPDGSVVTGTADNQGNYAIDIPTNVDLVGNEELVVTSTDGAGNVSPETRVTVKDTTAPVAPMVNEVTSESTQVTGTGEAGSTITVNFPDGNTATGTVDNQGNYAIDIPTTVDLVGNEELVVTSTDGAGNVSPETKVTVTDVTAPVAPTVNEVTSEGTQVAGSGEAGSTITVKFPDGSVVTGTADDQGNYAIDIPTTVDLVGKEELVVTSTDGAGNVSPEAKVTVRDVTAPDTPTVNEVTSEDTQVTGSGEAGSIITVKFPDGSVVTGVADDQGNYAIDLPVDKKLNGNEELVVTSTDVSGNVSPEAKVTVTDVTAPVSPTVNEVTSEGTQVTGVGEPGSTITVKFPDGSVATGVADDQGNYAIDLPIDKKLNGNEELVVTSTDDSGNVSPETRVTVKDTTAPDAPTVNEVTSEGTQVIGAGETGSTITVKLPDGSVVTGTVDSQGNYVIDLPVDKKLNGNEELVVTSTDASGNVSPEARVTVKDTTAPDAPTVNEVTSEGAQFTGTGEAGSTITVKFPDGSVVTGTADDQGNYAIDIPTNVDLVGNEELVVTSTDVSGNVSPETRETVKDVTAPVAPTVIEVTSEGTQVTGTGEAGSTITVKFPDGSVVTGTVDDQGNYAIDIPTNVDLVGKEELVVTSTDGAGNVSPETKVTVTDVTAPDVPTVNEVTSEGTQVTGTGEVGSTITVKFPDGSVATGTVDNQGNYAIDIPTNVDLVGKEELVVTSTDGAGNVSPEAKVTVTDVTAPVSPTVSEVTSEGTQVTGTGEPGSTITVKFPDGSVVTGTVDSQGNYVIDLPADKKLNGNEELVITSTDDSGNVSPEIKVTVTDATAPVAPTVNEVTSEGTQVTGTGEAGSTITVKFPDGSVVTGTVDSQGNYAIDLPADKKLNGNEGLVVTSTDVSGNVSPETRLTVTDVTAPDAPTVNEVTSEGTQVTGTGEAGSTIIVKFPDGSVVTGTADDQGNYAIDIPTTVDLVGKENLVVTSTDESGNISPETKVTVTDVTAPVAPAVNEVTSEGTQVTGTGEAGSTITVKFPDGSVVTGTADDQGNYAIDIPTNLDLVGKEELVVTSTDGAGNVSPETKVTVTDVTAPVAPTVNEVTSEGTQVTGTGETGSTITVKFPDGSVVTGTVNDQGNYAIDIPTNVDLVGNEELVVTSTDVSRNVSPETRVTVKDAIAPVAPTVNEVTSEGTQVTGTGEAGSTITVKFPDGSVVTGVADDQGNYAIDIPTNVDLVGNEELVVTSTDGAGNVSPETKVKVTDATVPNAPTVNEVTSEGAQVTGTGEAGSTITVKFPDGSVVTGTADDQGNYAIDIPTNVDLVGNEELVVTSTDGAGNVSPETKVTVTDVTAPVAPTVNEVTSEGTQVTGTGEAGSTITVKFPDGSIVTGTVDSQGNYTIDLPVYKKLNGNEELVVTSTDVSGNVSPETRLTVKDTTAPDAPTVNEVTSEGTQVTGTGEAGSTITIKLPDGSTVTGEVDNQGNYAIDIPTNVDLVGNEELVVTSTDGVGNVSPETRVTVKDVTAPNAPTVNEVTSEGTQVTGTGEAGSTITVKFPDGSVVTGVADDQGNYVIDLPVNKKLNGNEELVVTSTDGAGNVSPETKVTVKDVTVPVAPTVNEVTSEDSQVTGTGEAGSTITIKLPDGSTVTGEVDNQGNYAIDIPTNVDLVGNEELVVTSTDASGNVSPETKITVTDVTVPVAPMVNEVTSEGTQVTGTGEAGSTITIKLPDGSTVTGEVDNQGNYAIDIPTNVDLVGNEELVVTSTDASGNVSPETRATVKDATAPDAPTVSEVTSEGTQVTGTGEAGSTITVKFPDGSVVTGVVDNQGNYAIDIPTNVDLVGNEELVVTSTDASGNVSPETRATVKDATAPDAPTVSEGTQVTGTGEAGSTITVKFPDGSVVTGVVDDQGNYAIDIPTNVDLVGNEELVVTSTDGAGNVSPETKVTVTDATVPNAPTVSQITSEDSQVSGTGEAGSTITVKFPDGSVVTGEADDQGNYAIDIPINVDLVGNEELVVTSTDDSGNVSPETRLTVKDTTTPAAPTVNEVTSEGTQVTGTGEAGSTITVKFPDGSIVTGVVDDQGNYAIDIPTNVDLVGNEELVVTSTDGAGNVSPETKVTVTDVTAPVAPTVNEVTSEDSQVTGTGEPGSTITVKFPDGSVVTGTADDQGNYAIDIPTNVDLLGNEELVVTSTDVAGNVSSETRVTVKDVTAPSAPTVNEVTSEGTQVTGTSEAGSTITVKLPDGSVVTGTVDNQGNYVIDLPVDKKLNGNEGLVITSTDSSGNVSPETKVTVTDATAPAAPTVNEVTSEGTQVTGTGEAGSTITVKFPDGSVVTGTVDNQGNYTIDLPVDKKLNGNEELVVTSTDDSGNVSPETRLTVKDTTAPDAPTMKEVTSEDSQVSGTGEAGSTITIKFPDGSVVTGRADNQGNYAIDLPVDKKLNGNEELVVTSTDDSGNVSPETKVTVTDATVPNAPTVTEVTSEDTQVTGSGEAGSTITVKFPDGSVVTGTADNQGNYLIDLPVDKKLNGNEELVVTSTDDSGNVSPETKVTVKDVTAPDAPTVSEVTSESTQVTGTGEAGSTITVKFPDGSVVTGTVDSQGNYLIDLPADKKLNGNEELVVTSTDDSGNVSPETRVTVKDTTAPVEPTMNEVTSENTQVTGTGEPGSMITVKFPGGSVVTGVADDKGNYAIDLPIDKKLKGNEKLVVTSTDDSGNVSPETRVTVKDTTAPVEPTMNEVTSENTQVTGTGEPGSMITVKFPGGSVVTGVADDKGNYAIDLPIDKKLKGNEKLVVTSTDDSGNVSPETRVTVKDTTAPVEPTMNEVTSENTQVTGTGEPGSMITVKFPGGSVVTGVADDKGNYAIDLPIDKKLKGNEKLVVTSTDGAGNVSPETRVTVKDTTAPDAPTVNEVTSEGTQVTGTGEVGSTITVKFPDGSIVTGTVDSQGNYAIDLPADKNLNGHEELVITSTDSSGNVSRETKVTVKDMTAPNTPTVNEVTSGDTQITGTGEPGSTITVKFPDGSVITGTVDNQGNYVIDLPADKNLNGNEELVVTSTDSSGNVSREAKVTVKDTTAPAAPTVNEVTSGDTQLTGTGEPGSTITVKFPDGSVVTGTVDNQGNYVIDLPVDKKLNGNEELVVTSTDQSGNVSREVRVTVKDTTAPAAPTVNKVTSGDTQLTGTGEPGSTITVKFPDGSVVTGTVDNQGNYVIDLPVDKKLNGNEELVVTSTDQSGNVSREVRVTVKDTTAPAAPTVNKVTSGDTQLTGTGEPGSTITVKFPDGSVVTGTVDNQGNYVIDLPVDKKLNGNEELVVTSTDQSGNVSREVRVTVKDTTAPAAPTVNKVTSGDTKVTGTGEPGSTITVKFPNGTIVTGKANNQGNYVINVPSIIDLNPGDTIQVSSIDKSGNMSGTTTIIVNNSSASITKQANDHDKFSNNFDLNSQLGLNGIEGEDGKEHRNPNSNSKHSDDSVNHKSGTDIASKGDVIQANDKKGTISTMNNDKNNLDKGNNKHVDKLPTTGENENQDKGLFSSLLAMIGAFILIGRRRKNKEEH